ncbi:MAG TPA: glycosyl hydrolase family 18 protein, partial [Acidimicrobiales bacterium]|nr:glycosyl hydrolase family 18 protein [Acidimicrobiales bacterium]
MAGRGDGTGKRRRAAPAHERATGPRTLGDGGATAEAGDPAGARPPYGRRRIVVGLVLLAVLVVAGGAVALVTSHHPAKPPAPAAIQPSAAQRAAERELARETKAVAEATSRVSLDYPTVAGQPAPLWTAHAFDAPLPSHVVLGFVPYYALGELTPADYADVSTIAYDGVELTSGGGFDEQSTDLGWQALHSPAFATLVTDAHEDKDQVLLTVFTETQSVISAITAHPASAGKRLADQIQPVLADDRLDGVDVDVEGSGKSERPGFVSFMRAFTTELRDTDPSAVIVLDTYPGSADDPQSFFDVAALAPLVDTMFVMAYDMYQPGRASPNAPLASPVLGLSDVQT